MMRKLILTIFLIFAFAVPASATDYYIDYVGGDDTKDGLSEANAWQHFPTDSEATDTADAHSLACGNRYIFERGVTYDFSGSDGPNVLLVSGLACTSGNEIEITSLAAWGSGDYAIFDGGDAVLARAWSIYNTDYAILSNLKVENVKGHAFVAWGSDPSHCNNITFEDDYAHTFKALGANAYYGFYVTGDADNCIVQDSEAYQCSYGVYMDGDAGTIVRRVTSHDNGEDGFRTLNNAVEITWSYLSSYDNDFDGFDFYGSKNQKVSYSLAHDNGANGFKAGGTSEEAQADSRGTVISYSLAWSNGSAGFTSNTGEGQSFLNCTAYDNTLQGFLVYDNYDVGYAWTVKNCIGYENGNYDFRFVPSGTTAIDADYNCWYSAAGNIVHWDGDDYGAADLAAYKAAVTPDEQNTMFSHPQMTDPANDDFTLQGISPCIDSGVYVPGYDTACREDLTFGDSSNSLTMPNAGADGKADIGAYPYPKWGAGGP